MGPGTGNGGPRIHEERTIRYDVGWFGRETVYIQVERTLDFELLGQLRSRRMESEMEKIDGKCSETIPIISQYLYAFTLMVVDNFYMMIHIMFAGRMVIKYISIGDG